MWIFFHRSRSFKARLLTRGFTVIELMVVVGIMLIMTSVLLLRQQKFDSATLLRSLGYSIALSVRQAQVYGSSVRENTTGGGSFSTSYGIYISTADLAHYYLFADNGDGVYTGDSNNNGICDMGEDCIVTRFTIGKGTGSDYRIKKFCATTISGSIQYCSDQGGGPTWLSIFFRRPNTDACFATSLDVAPACLSPNPIVYQSGYIQIIGPDGVTTRSVNVTQTGSISVGMPGT